MLLFVEQVRPSMNFELDRVKEMCQNNIVDRDSASILMNAYYTCRPEERPKVRRVELPPTQRYLRHLLTEELYDHETDDHVNWIVGKIRKYRLHDDTVLEMVVQEFLRIPSACYPKVQSIAHAARILGHYVPRFQMMLVDAIFEQICLLLDFMKSEKYQEMLALMDFVNELYLYEALDNGHILFILYLFIEYNHYVGELKWW